MTLALLLLGGCSCTPSATSPGSAGRTHPGRRGLLPRADGLRGPLPAPDTVRVNVYNATSRQGLAGASPPDLRDQGFAVAKVGNDPRHRTSRGAVRSGTARAARWPRRLARIWMARARLVRDHRRDATIDLVAGKRVSGLRTAAAPRPVRRGGRGAPGLRLLTGAGGQAWSGGATATADRPGSCSNA